MILVDHNARNDNLPQIHLPFPALSPPIFVMSSHCGSATQPAAAVTSASAAAAADAAVAARMVLIGGWSGDGRSGGRRRSTGWRAGGCAANGTAVTARAGLGDYDPQFGGCGSDVVEDNSGCHGYTCDVTPSTNANVYFHHK